MENNNKIPLIERIVVCGISKEKIDNFFNNNKIKNLDEINKINIEILEDYKSNFLLKTNKKYNEYLKNIPKYSLPEGIKLKKNHFINYSKNNIKSFLLVNDSKLKFCSTLIFYENYNKNNKQFSILKSLTLVSNKDFFNTHKNILENIKEILSNKNNNFILKLYFNILLNYIEINKKNSSNSSFFLKNINNINKPLINFHFDSKNPFPLKDFNISIILDNFYIEDLIKIYLSILMEYKIILIFSDINEINIVINSLLALIYPLKWNFPISSYLLPETEVMLDAPFACLIGVEEKYLNLIKFRIKKNLFNPETVIYCLNKKEFLFLENFNFKIEENLENEIKSELYFIFSQRFNENEINKNSEFFRMFNNNNNEKNYLNNEINKNLFYNMKIISIFFNIFLNLIENFKNFIKFDDNLNYKNCQISDFFNFKQFENYFYKNKKSEKNYFNFFKNFINSLMFSNFLRNFMLKNNSKEKYKFINEIYYLLLNLKEKKIKKKLNENFLLKIKNKILNYDNFQYFQINEKTLKNSQNNFNNDFFWNSLKNFAEIKINLEEFKENIIKIKNNNIFSHKKSNTNSDLNETNLKLILNNSNKQINNIFPITKKDKNLPKHFEGFFINKLNGDEDENIFSEIED